MKLESVRWTALFSLLLCLVAAQEEEGQCCFLSYRHLFFFHPKQFDLICLCLLFGQNIWGNLHA